MSSTSYSCRILISSSIGTATLVGFGLLNYRWIFSAGRFLQSAAASGTSNPQLGGQVIRMFQLPPPDVPHAWSDASEPQQRKVELWARNFREFCRKWRLPRHFWVLLHATTLRHGTDGFTSPPKEGVLRIFSPEKIRRFRPGLNPRTLIPEASTLTSRPPKPCRILTKHDFSQDIFEKYLSKKFHENLTSGSLVVPCGITNERTEG